MNSDEVKWRMTGLCTELVQTQDNELPELIRDAGGAARFAFEEFLHGKICNRFTRKAHLHSVKRFSEWCAGRQLDLVRITPADVGRYLDSMTASTPTRKLHLAALRRFFDELVMRHVVILNPALSVRTELMSNIWRDMPILERHGSMTLSLPTFSLKHRPFSFNPSQRRGFHRGSAWQRRERFF